MKGFHVETNDNIKVNNDDDGMLLLEDVVNDDVEAGKAQLVDQDPHVEASDVGNLNQGP